MCRYGREKGEYLHKKVFNVQLRKREERVSAQRKGLFEYENSVWFLNWWSFVQSDFFLL